MNPFDPMPTIKAILGMPIYEAVKESQILAHLDDFDVPRCEEGGHDVETAHHSGAAKYLFTTPCGHGSGYVCGRFAEWISSERKARCGDCGLICDSSLLTFIPIGGAL